MDSVIESANPLSRATQSPLMPLQLHEQGKFSLELLEQSEAQKEESDVEQKLCNLQGACVV